MGKRRFRGKWGDWRRVGARGKSHRDVIGSRGGPRNWIKGGGCAARDVRTERVPRVRRVAADSPLRTARAAAPAAVPAEESGSTPTNSPEPSGSSGADSPPATEPTTHTTPGISVWSTSFTPSARSHPWWEILSRRSLNAKLSSPCGGRNAALEGKTMRRRFRREVVPIPRRGPVGEARQENPIVTVVEPGVLSAEC
jgi:hypothetical protein